MKTKVLLIDNPDFKTTSHIRDWLMANPDIEFQHDMYADPEKMAWADVIWVEWCEYASQIASHRRYDDSTRHLWNDAENRFGPGGSRDWSKARLIIRGVDIDILYGHYAGVKWENVDHFLFIAKHVKEYAWRNPSIYPSSLDVRVIPLGLDVSKWTYRERDPKGNLNVAIVHHNWSGKSLPLLAQAISALVGHTSVLSDRPWDWKFHLVGTWSNEAWLPQYFWHICDELGIRDRIQYSARVDDLDTFLDGFDYSISASSKEAFSLTTAEAAAKGMKPLIHNFQGAKDLWPDEFVWTTVDEFVHKMMQPVDSKHYREVVERYDFKNIIPQFADLFTPKA